MVIRFFDHRTMTITVFDPRTNEYVECILCKRPGTPENDLQSLESVAAERKWPIENLKQGTVCKFCRSDGRLDVVSILYTQ